MSTDKMDSKNTTKSTNNVPEEPMVPTFGRCLFLAAGAVNFGCGLGLPISLSVMFLDWQESFSTTRAVTAAVHSTCVGIVFGGGVIAGYVVNKFGARVSFILGSFLATLGMFLGAFATNIPFLLASVGILAGCGCCLIQLPTIPCATRSFKKNQGVAIAGVTTGAGVFTLALPYLYDYLIQTYSWRGAFIIISGLCLNTLVLQLILTSFEPSTSTQLQISVPSPEAAHLMPDDTDVISSEAVNVNGCYVNNKLPSTYDGLSGELSDGQLCGSNSVIDKAEFNGDVCMGENIKGNTNMKQESKWPSGAGDEMKDISGDFKSNERKGTTLSYAESDNFVSKNLDSEVKETKFSIDPTYNIQNICDGVGAYALGNSSEQQEIGEKEETECFLISNNHQTACINGAVNSIQSHKIEASQNNHYEENSPINDGALAPMDIDIQVEPSVISASPSPSRHFFSRLRHSAWKFLFYPLTWSVLAFLGLTLGVQFTTQMLTMDIAANKGFPEHGLFFIMLGILTGLVGKILSGVIGYFRRIPSFLVLGASGVLGSGALAMMGLVTSLSATAASMGLIGLSLGVIVSVFPKCFLDLPSMDADSYPLALGLGNMVEGVFDFVVPILVGHMVDVSGTYTLPFTVLSVVSLLSSCVLMLVYRWT